MARRLRILLAMAALAGLGLALAPAVAAGDPCYHGYTIPATTSGATTTVNLEPCAVVPTVARVAPGTTVSFVNVSLENHLVTGSNSRWGDRDKELPPGAKLSVRFDQPGIYAYSCALHRGMSGVIVVGGTGGTDAAAAAATTPTDSGGGPGTTVIIGGLGALAALGWATALIGRRRAASITAPTTTG